jgi:transposase
MERSAMQLLHKRGKSQRQIARELGHSRMTVARALEEPVDRRPAQRRRSSIVDPYREEIGRWLEAGLTAERMLELARSDPDQPYQGGHSVFRDAVHRERLRQKQDTVDVPVRFEGLPGEYLQVDWGEIRRFPFSRHPRGTRYFLACRLKYSRWTWVWFTHNMRQETLLRGLVACFCALGWVPWVLVFDNMKTVTSGRDPQGQPVWTAALLQLASEFGFHPEACSPGAGNQKGSVESLVKWVKGNFLSGRDFADDADLAQQQAAWQVQANGRPSSATRVAPNDLLTEEAAQGGKLPASAQDYGFLQSAQVNRESLVPVFGNQYSVPVNNVSAPVTVRVHRERIVIWRDITLLARHDRAPDGAHRRVVTPEHFAPLFGRKPRAQVMLYRQALLDLGEVAQRYVNELSHRKRAQLREEVLGIYALLETYGTGALQAAMAAAERVPAYGAEYLGALLKRPATPPQASSGTLALLLKGVPDQTEIDRQLNLYEAYVRREQRPEPAEGPALAGAGR